MKKTYITPRAENYVITCPHLLASSFVHTPIYGAEELPEDENEEMW